jgi:CarD family transcriptional regulator
VKEKGLSVADMRMLAKAREMLISELTFVIDSTAERAEAMVDDALERTP